jgi:glycosyltransferase involved in cell wall biosynthesis
LANALIVSRYFPPLGTAGGSIRLVKFIKYLSNWDWKFVVFTQDMRQTVVPEQILCSFLLDELPADIVVQRIEAPFSANQSNSSKDASIFRKMFGDSSLAWGLRVFWKGLVEMRKSRIDLVFGVTPPFTSALITMLLSWVGHKPFVLDLKDDWVGSPTFKRKNIFRQKFEMFLESLIVHYASAVITVTPQSHRLYVERYAHLGQPEKFHLIPNGCDLDEYDDLGHRERRIDSHRFLILSAAWGFRKDYRDIGPFLLGLDVFFRRHTDARDKVDVVLLGDSLSAEYHELLIGLNLDKVIQRAGAVKRNKLIEWLWKADLFLLVQPVHNTTAISGTLYEYWAAGKAPVLLISENGASSALVEENQIGKHFHFDQISEIAEYIEKIFDAYESGQPIWIEREGITNFDRKALARHMADVWQKALSTKS